MLLAHCIRRAASRAAWTAGKSSAISTAMIAMTTSSSISVKPRGCGGASVRVIVGYLRKGWPAKRPYGLFNQAVAREGANGHGPRPPVREVKGIRGQVPPDPDRLNDDTVASAT